MEEKTCKTPRRPNWTEKEKIVLVEAVRQREDRLFGKMKGPGGVKNVKIKEGAWEEVAGAVNANSDTTQRTVDEIKKQYANIKQRAKEKSDAIRRPVTGGGPKPPSPTPVEAELLSHLEDRPTLCGLSTGHDTEEVILTVVPEEMHTMTNDCMPSTSASGTGVSAIYEIQNDATQLGIVNLELPPSFSSAKTSKRGKTMEEDEIMTMRAEREKYIQESKKFKEEAEFYRVNTMYIKMKMKELHAGKDSEM